MSGDREGTSGHLARLRLGEGLDYSTTEDEAAAAGLFIRPIGLESSGLDRDLDVDAVEMGVARRRAPLETLDDGLEGDGRGAGSHAGGVGDGGADADHDSGSGHFFTSLLYLLAYLAALCVVGYAMKVVLLFWLGPALFARSVTWSPWDAWVYGLLAWVIALAVSTFVAAPMWAHQRRMRKMHIEAAARDAGRRRERHERRRMRGGESGDSASESDRESDDDAGVFALESGHPDASGIPEADPEMEEVWREAFLRKRGYVTTSEYFRGRTREVLVSLLIASMASFVCGYVVKGLVYLIAGEAAFRSAFTSWSLSPAHHAAGFALTLVVRVAYSCCCSAAALSSVDNGGGGGIGGSGIGGSGIGGGGSGGGVRTVPARIVNAFRNRGRISGHHTSRGGTGGDDGI